MELKFDRDGLIPVVVQDYYTKQVLTLAYMNRESLDITLKEGYTCFYSRSRQELWRKGETSGNKQRVASIKSDCDLDAVVVEVIKDGPACHTGAESCFFNEVYQDASIGGTPPPPEGDVSPFRGGREEFSIDALYTLLQGRKTEKKEGSYTTYLFEKGLDKILKKVGEECTEVIIAAKDRDKDETVFEISDLVYHVLVLMVEAGIEPKDIIAQLASRHVIDHKVKQEKMK